MGNRVLEIIKQVGIFMICAQMIMHFKPAEQYGKYIRLLVSMMVLVQLVVPVLGLLGGGGVQAFGETLLSYEILFAEGMADISAACVESERLLEKLTMEEIKTRINNLNEEQNAEGNLQEEAVQGAESGEGVPKIAIEGIEVKTDG